MCVCVCCVSCVFGPGVCVLSGGVIAVYWSPAAWCLRNEGVSSVLLGASNTDQLMENIGAIQVRPQNECVCVCTHVCCSEEQITGFICECLNRPVSWGRALLFVL